MLEDDNVGFDEFYEYLQDNEIGDWDCVNHEETIRQYCIEMMKKGIHISHILKAIEENQSDKELYGIWLGNSMETPSPINNKKDLVRELGIGVKEAL